MSYYILCKITCDSDLIDMLIAELAEVNFEGFMENESGFEAYLIESDFNKDALEEILQRYAIPGPAIEISRVAQQNWNAAWESSFEPVCIEDQLHIRAPFHNPDPTFPIEIIIQPKTSFGTGHHETTYTIMQLMLGMNLQGTHVFDYGSGTGILAILAAKLGATQIVANDIDTWAAENILENIALNNTEPIQFISGDLTAVPIQEFDVILANINRNILMESFDALFSFLRVEGSLLISGFYITDLFDLQEKAQSYGFVFKGSTEQNNWCAALFTK